MKALQPKDFRQGKTFYYVSAFPLEGRTYGHAEVEPVRVACRAYKHKNLGLWFDQIVFSTFYKSKPYRTKNSLRDAGVVPNHYNMHRMFRTRKQAQRYADRMNNLQLTADEYRKAAGIVANNEEFSYMDSYNPYFDEPELDEPEYMITTLGDLFDVAPVEHRGVIRIGEVV